jgi:transcriptional regulator with XRE-family HTH domain
MKPGPFGKRLRELRQWMRLSVEVLGHNAGVHPAMIYAYEAGYKREPKFSTVAKLAKALGVPMERLVG